MSEVRYSVTIFWAKSPFARVTVEAKDYETPQAAFAACLWFAKRKGYQPPKWWEWWRLFEPRWERFKAI